MSQAPANPFTQAASQGYGDFAATVDEDEEEEEQQEHPIVDEEQPDGPQSPEPEEELDENGSAHRSIFFNFASSRFHSDTGTFVSHGNRFPR